MQINIKSEPRNRSWIIFDIESAVTDESGHRRYQQMERYVPRDDDGDQIGRRGYSAPKTRSRPHAGSSNRSQPPVQWC